MVKKPTAAPKRSAAKRAPRAGKSPATRPQPHDAEKLLNMGWRYFEKTTGIKIAEIAHSTELKARTAEDAVMEYVYNGLEAAAKDDGKGNVQAYQVRCATGGMLNFWKREKRAAARIPAECPKSARRMSLDSVVKGMEGEQTTLVEIVRDPNMPAPCSRYFEKIRHKELRDALARLPAEERDTFLAVHDDDLTQEKAGEQVGLTRNQIRDRLPKAHYALFIEMIEHRSRYNPDYLPPQPKMTEKPAKPAKKKGKKKRIPAPPYNRNIYQHK